MDEKMGDMKLWKITLLMMEDIAMSMSTTDNITSIQVTTNLKRKYFDMIFPGTKKPTTTTLKRNRSRLSTDKIKKKKMNKKMKKTKIMDGPDLPRDMPPRTLDVIKNQMGGGDEPMLILQKKLTESDLRRSQNRLSIPVLQLVSTAFLTVDEKAQAVKRLEGGRIEGLGVTVIEPRCEINTKMVLKEWEMNNCRSYMLTGSGYGELVVRNGLRAGQVVQVWFFRDALGNPYFAIVNLDDDGSLPLP